MKVLLVSVKSEKSKGGIAVWTNQYLAGCKNAGIDCDIVNTEAVGKIAVNATAKRNIRDEFIRTRRINQQLKEYLKGEHYDVAHLNTSIGLLGIVRDYYVARKIAKKGIPLVVHFHCDIPYWVRNPLVKLYLKKMLGLSNANFVLCENSQQYLKKEFGVESVMIPNFVEETLIVKEKQIRSKIEKVCFVGRVTLEKGAREILETAQAFPNIQFQLAGEVTEEIASLTKSSNVEFLGLMSHDDIIYLLDEADVFIFPSHTEGFSLALAESMVRGLPSVATNVGANASMLENHGGFVVEAGDVSSIKEAISKMQEASVRKEMSQWCIEKVRDNYTVTSVMNDFVSQYKRVMGDKNVGIYNKFKSK